MRALSLLAWFLALWAGTAMLLSRLPCFRDSVRLAERLAPRGSGMPGRGTFAGDRPFCCDRHGQHPAPSHRRGRAIDEGRPRGI
jgi:hypothetical protein